MLVKFMNLVFTHLIEVATIVVAGTLTGNELAVALFFHPRMSSLDDATHVRAVKALAVTLGRVMPFWYALTAILSIGMAFSRPAGTLSSWLVFIAAGLFVAMIVYSVLLPVPINNQVARWQVESLPANWRDLRRRWDLLNTIRVIFLLLALTLLAASLALQSTT
jgi:hypothetical protein